MTTTAPRLATIVMYHVVRPANGLASSLKGLSLQAFEGQLDYLQAHYNPVSLQHLADASGGSSLPPRPVVLTFDDGYAGHYDLVFPRLRRRRIPATFFPVTSSLLERRVLDVNKIQLVLAATRDVAALVAELDAAIDRDTEAGGLSPSEYRQRWWRSSRFDPPEVVYVKRLLQHALPDHVRKPLVDSLFQRFVSVDEAAVAAELYMTAAQAAELRLAGMTIGAHADRHVRLPTLSKAAQAAEIDGALKVLDAVGTARRPFVFAYANGEYDDDSLVLLGERGCSAAVSTKADLARVEQRGLLTLPRLDTNDLPVDGSAAANDWTRRANG